MYRILCLVALVGCSEWTLNLDDEDFTGEEDTDGADLPDGGDGDSDGGAGDGGAGGDDDGGDGGSGGPGGSVDDDDGGPSYDGGWPDGGDDGPSYDGGWPPGGDNDPSYDGGWPPGGDDDPSYDGGWPGDDDDDPSYDGGWPPGGGSDGPSYDGGWPPDEEPPWSYRPFPWPPGKPPFHGDDPDDPDVLPPHDEDEDPPHFPGADEDLCRTQGYWKNHVWSWPVHDLTLGAYTYDAAELLAVLHTSPQGDASLVLARQLIPAKLNLGVGAPDPGISRVIADADAWLADHGTGLVPYHISTSSPEGAEAVALSRRKRPTDPSRTEGSRWIPMPLTVARGRRHGGTSAVGR